MRKPVCHPGVPRSDSFNERGWLIGFGGVLNSVRQGETVQEGKLNQQDKEGNGSSNSRRPLVVGSWQALTQGAASVAICLCGGDVDTRPDDWRILPWQPGEDPQAKSNWKVRPLTLTLDRVQQNANHELLVS